MPTLATDSTVLERLYAAAKVGASGIERREQRLSFVYGNLPKGSAVTKQQVAEALHKMDMVDGVDA